MACDMYTSEDTSYTDLSANWTIDSDDIVKLVLTVRLSSLIRMRFGRTAKIEYLDFVYLGNKCILFE